MGKLLEKVARLAGVHGAGAIDDISNAKAMVNDLVFSWSSPVMLRLKFLW